MENRDPDSFEDPDCKVVTCNKQIKWNNIQIALNLAHSKYSIMFVERKKTLILPPDQENYLSSHSIT